MTKPQGAHFREKAAVLETLNTHKHHLYYYRDCLLPCLELQLVIKERGREELSDYDLTLLRLIETGLIHPEGLATSTGLAPRTVNRFLHAKEGEDQVQWDDGRVSLTEIGKESLRLGVPIRHVQRAFRYCPLTQQLLPRDAYKYPFHMASELNREALAFKDLFSEPEGVPLAGLDLSVIDDKAALNLPDEAVGIHQFLSYEPGFQEGRLALTGKHNPEKAWILWESMVREYSPDAVKPLRAPLNLDEMRYDRNAEAQVSTRGRIASKLESDGASLLQPIKKDKQGLPFAVVKNASDKWLASTPPQENPWILLCGTRNQDARPVARLGSPEPLNGHTLRVYLDNPSLEADAELLRRLSDVIDSNLKKRQAERSQSIETILDQSFSSEELSNAAQLVQRLQLKRFNRWFGINKDARG